MRQNYVGLLIGSYVSTVVVAAFQFATCYGEIRKASSDINSCLASLMFSMSQLTWFVQILAFILFLSKKVSIIPSKRGDGNSVTVAIYPDKGALRNLCLL